MDIDSLHLRLVFLSASKECPSETWFSSGMIKQCSFSGSWNSESRKKNTLGNYSRAPVCFLLPQASECTWTLSDGDVCPKLTFGCEICNH